MKRSKAERRHNDWRKIHKRARIIKDVHRDNEWFDSFWASQEHRLSKNKVHCSCPLCSVKSKRNGYKISDLKKFEALQYSVEEADVNLNMTPRRGW